MYLGTNSHFKIDGYNVKNSFWLIKIYSLALSLTKTRNQANEFLKTRQNPCHKSIYDFRNNNKGIKYLILEKLPINKMYVYIITLSKQFKFLIEIISD